MKTATKIMLIIAVACLLVGIVLIGSYFIFINKSFSFPDISVPQTYTKNEMTASGIPDSIEISDVSRDIHVVLSTNEAVRLTYYTSEDTGYSVTEENGKLTVKYRQKLQSLNLREKIDICCTLYLPASYAGTLNLTTASGDVTLRGISAGNTNISAVSGDITLLKGTVLDKASLSTSSGDVVLEDASTASLSVSTVSGDTSGKRLVASDDVKVDSASGDVTLSALTAENIEIGTISGDVTLSLTAAKSKYSYKVSTVSGEVRVPKGTGANTVKINTTSGDITVIASK